MPLLVGNSRSKNAAAGNVHIETGDGEVTISATTTNNDNDNRWKFDRIQMFVDRVSAAGPLPSAMPSSYPINEPVSNNAFKKKVPIYCTSNQQAGTNVAVK